MAQTMLKREVCRQYGLTLVQSGVTKCSLPIDDLEYSCGSLRIWEITKNYVCRIDLIVLPRVLFMLSC